jgi:murein DD-endopeptidase MepM/ murein hydrolase activator NlpD
MFHKPVASFPNCGVYRKFGWGGNHTGDDYPCTVGSYVCAVKDGEVVLSAELNGFGSLEPSSKGGCIIIRHQYQHNASSNKDFFGIYGHLDRWIEVGSSVKRGQVIGTIRSFTNSKTSCPHLHFGVYTGSVMPIDHLGYNKSLTWYHDPDVWLATYSTDSDSCASPLDAEWEPILSCS